MKVKELFPLQQESSHIATVIPLPSILCSHLCHPNCRIGTYAKKTVKGKLLPWLVTLCPSSKGKEENEKEPTCDVKCYGAKPVMKDNRFLQRRVDNDIISSDSGCKKKITLGIRMKVHPILCINAYKNYTFQI